VQGNDGFKVASLTSLTKMFFNLIFIALAFVQCIEPFPSIQQAQVSGLGSNNNDGEQASRFLSLTKRSSVQFGVMILCKVGRNPFEYNGYGCYCGIGGKGQPVDKIDQCCYEHDKCYENLRKNDVCDSKSDLYLTTYLVKGCTDCVAGNSRCPKELCECDAAVAKCFKKNDSEFNNRHKNYNTSFC